ncbi:MAG TPA: YeeE/YedE family protein, partial [Terriglobia bacterium]|nr:YeeE/YedE family protein [Terriglobia bacterium]
MPLLAGAGLAVGVLLTAYLGRSFGWRHGLLFVVGVLAGAILYHASFGFTSAWRVLLADRRSAGLRAQMLMLG